nr:MAG TPA: hypothetical protein [Caudoviricetes sp.]
MIFKSYIIGLKTLFKVDYSHEPYTQRSLIYEKNDPSNFKLIHN